VAFTGKLGTMSRDEAHRLVAAAGGTIGANLTRKTGVLVVGMRGWPLLPSGAVSERLQRAEALNREGCGIRIISELKFLEFIGRTERRDELHQTYAAEDVCKLLNVDAATLQRWEQFSLIHSNGGYYDFQDLVSLQTIARLIHDGVRPEVIAQSLHDLSSVLPDTQRPLAQLKIVAEHSHSILADFGQLRISPAGQLCFRFDSARLPPAAVVELPQETRSSQEWFELGQHYEEQERYEEAIDAYRKCLALSPRCPEAYFNLGNVLRELGDRDGAEQSFRMAIAQDPAFAPAWYNIADVQEQRGKLFEAIASLQAALTVSPEYADAHFNLAVFLEKAGRLTEAQAHWRAYLELDPESQWSAVARERLREASTSGGPQGPF
jgi:tetratricopeptide (TPR) repeat protein